MVGNISRRGTLRIQSAFMGQNLRVSLQCTLDPSDQDDPIALGWDVARDAVHIFLRQSAQDELVQCSRPSQWLQFTMTIDLGKSVDLLSSQRVQQRGVLGVYLYTKRTLSPGSSAVHPVRQGFTNLMMIILACGGNEDSIDVD